LASKGHDKPAPAEGQEADEKEEIPCSFLVSVTATMSSLAIFRVFTAKTRAGFCFSGLEALLLEKYRERPGI
jgi:hypothetical protein